MMRHIQIKKRRCVPLLALALGALMAGTVACWWNVVPTPTPRSEVTVPTPTPSAEVLVPTPTPRSQVAQNTIWSVSPSIEEQILTSSVIVRASLLSAAAATETVPSDEGVASTFRPVQELSFRVHEYLKGSGPATTLVVVRGDRTYLTDAEALQAATESVARRNTTWDGREGILFLKTPDQPYSPTGGTARSAEGTPAPPAFAFTLFNSEWQSEWDYSVDTLSRAWLPARDGGGASGNGGRSTDAATQVFITDGATSPPPVVSLADLRSRITEINALLEAGTGEAYQNCIYKMITRERHRRAQPWSPYPVEADLDSGSTEGVLIHNELYSGPRVQSGYHNYWLSGPNMELFQAANVDDDTDPTNGYDNRLTTVRPLPGGEYRVFYNMQHYNTIPCNFKPLDAYQDVTVTVTAPTGTLHEAFFDSGAAGFSPVMGSLEPAGFTLGGAATAIGGLLWQSGSVVLTLAPYSAMTTYALDFIALDGSVSLTLTGATATSNSADGTLTWPVAEQPWRDGDQFMLRIRESGATPAPTPTPSIPGAADAWLEPDPLGITFDGQWREFTIRGTGVESVELLTNVNNYPDGPSSTGAVELESYEPLPSASDACRKTYFSGYSVPVDFTFSLVGCRAGTVIIQLQNPADGYAVLREYTITVSGGP